MNVRETPVAAFGEYTSKVDELLARYRYAGQQVMDNVATGV